MYLYRIGIDWDWKLGIIKFRYEFIKNINIENLDQKDFGWFGFYDLLVIGMLYENCYICQFVRNFQ